MKSLPLRYVEARDVWQLSCPRAPTPNQVAYIKTFMRDQAGKLPAGPPKAALYEGRVEFQVLGENMNGKGDIRLFEAPKPREVMGVF